VSDVLRWAVAIAASIGLITLAAGLLAYAKIHEDP
jgi:hypothetical protein